MAYILSIGYEACKRSYKGSGSADVYAEKKGTEIFGELGKKDCGRNVAYKLAGKNGNKKGVFRKKCGEKFVHGVDPCKVSGKDEEKEESSEKRIINFIKGIFINKEKNRGDYCKTEPERNYSENNKDRKSKENHIKKGLFNMELFGEIFMERKFFGFYEKTGNRKHSYCKKERRKHNFCKFVGWNFKERIKIKVLGVSEGGQHTAEVCRNILQNKKICHILFSVSCLKSKVLSNVDSAHDNFEQIIYSNIFSDLAIEELAEMCNRSLTSFKKEFKRHFFMPPHRWFIKQRLIQSRLLLISTSKSISEIGIECTFPNTSHFIKLFKKQYGTTPAIYRNTHCNMDEIEMNAKESNSKEPNKTQEQIESMAI